MDEKGGSACWLCDSELHAPFQQKIHTFLFIFFTLNHMHYNEIIHRYKKRKLAQMTYSIIDSHVFTELLKAN